MLMTHGMMLMLLDGWHCFAVVHLFMLMDLMVRIVSVMVQVIAVDDVGMERPI